MTSPNVPPQDPTAAFAKRIRDLELKVEALQKGDPLKNASIGKGGLRFYDGGRATFEDGGGVDVTDGGGIDIHDGGGIDIHDGGRFNAKHPGEGADDAFSAGLVRSEDGSTAGYGMLVQQANGEDIFSARTDEASGGSRVVIWDRHGEAMVLTDPVAGGLTRPLIPFVFVPYWSTAWESTSSTEFEPLLQAYVRRGSPKGQLRVNGYTPAGTSGEVRVRVAEVQVGATLVVPGGATQGATITFDMPTPLDWSTVEVVVDARVTSGTAPIGVRVSWATSWS